MSISIGANVAGTRLLDVSLSRPSERDASTEAAMTAQNAAAETRSKGLRQDPTEFDRLLDSAGSLDKFGPPDRSGSSDRVAP